MSHHVVVNHPDYLLYHGVLGIVLRVIFFLERRSEQCGECLVEFGFETSYESLYQFIAGLVALPVNEFDEQFSLG